MRNAVLHRMALEALFLRKLEAVNARAGRRGMLSN